MNAVQRRLIEGLLPSLIENTDVNDKLLSILKERKLLSEDDVKNLTETSTNSDRAAMLYKLIQEKPGGYQGIGEALQETDQVKASDILFGTIH